jgi:hypothetical protein
MQRKVSPADVAEGLVHSPSRSLSERDVTEFSVGFHESCCGLNLPPKPFTERDNKFFAAFHIFLLSHLDSSRE